MTIEPFRFGVQLYSATDVAIWRRRVELAAELGYTAVFLPDHVGGQFGPLAGLAAAATASADIRLGTLVLNTALRNPVVLAKELTTLDVISGGRMEIGLGGGWQVSDFLRTGIRPSTSADRVRRVSEYIDVLEAFWRGVRFSYHGMFYQVEDVVCEPRPVQATLPLTVGGASAKLLRLAGQRARIAALDVAQPSGQFERRAFMASATSKAFYIRAQHVREAAAEAGRFVTLQMCVPADLVHPDATAKEIRAVAERWQIDRRSLDDSPLALVGDIDYLVDRLLAWRKETGVSYIVVQDGAMERAAPLVARLAPDWPTC